MRRKVHIFDNGVMVYDDQLLPVQRERYAKKNIHEPDEEEYFINIIEAIPNDGCYVSIGTAIGYYTILAKMLSPLLNIHAVEPLEVHRKYFYENIELNQLHQNDFTTHTEGVAPMNGQAALLDRSFGSSIVSSNAPKEYFDQERSRGVEAKTVEVITLDTLVERVGNNVDLIQMDIQGLELDALNSGMNSIQNGRIGTFLIGTHSPELHQGCINLLEANGYKISHEVGNPKEQPDGIIIANYRGINKN